MPPRPVDEHVDADQLLLLAAALRLRHVAADRLARRAAVRDGLELLAASGRGASTTAWANSLVPTFCLLTPSS